MSYGHHSLVKCIAVNIRLLLTNFKQSSGSRFLQLSDVACQSSAGEHEDTTSWMFFFLYIYIWGFIFSVLIITVHFVC